MTFTKNTYIDDDEDIEHLEATQKILGIITEIYDDITTTIVGDEIEKKEG